MKRLLTIIAFCATAFATAGAFTTPAAADSGRHGSSLYTRVSGGHAVLSFSSGERRHGVRRAERRHHKMRRHRKFERRQYARQGHFPRHGQRLGHTRRMATPNCHPVRQRGVDRHGYRVLLGGVMCYDAYGTSYFVDGSRTLIRRY
jgi:hypothetical protein